MIDGVCSDIVCRSSTTQAALTARESRLWAVTVEAVKTGASKAHPAACVASLALLNELLVQVSQARVSNGFLRLPQKLNRAEPCKLDHLVLREELQVALKASHNVLCSTV